MGRFLITTADERTWKFDRPVLLSGEWCRLYGRKHLWSDMDAVVARPYGLEAGQKERDQQYVKILLDQLLKEVALALNAFHGTCHSLRFWEIVLGHWLQRYVSTVFNRFFTMEQVLSEHDVSGVATFVDADDYSLATGNTMDFIWACDNDAWNHVLNMRILDFTGRLTPESDGVTRLGETGFMRKAVQKKQGVIHSFLHAANSLVQGLSRERDAFIINSYLPLKKEIWLQLGLGQCPQLWMSPALSQAKPDPTLRQRFKIESEGQKGFEKFVRIQLGQTLPTCYLEGYGELLGLVNSLPWPESPKFIYTANSFDTDEVFKVWTGLKVEKGSPYFTGQHGNNYGTHFYHGNSHWPDRAAVDKFFSWGWSDGTKKTVPAFAFTIAGRKEKEFSPDGGVLLVEVCQYPRMTPWDGYYEYGNYRENQLCFAENLPESIRQELVVRLHHAWRAYRWEEGARWKERFPNIQLETGARPIRELIAQSRLVVHSYDSTGILETLALNIPTMCYWHGGLEHLLPSARPYYELLRKAGILADSPEHAAKLVALRWDDIGSWWESQTVQEARKEFCERYAKVEKRPAITMRRLLTAQTTRGK